MAIDAVVLTYLEWARLTSRGWLRLYPARVARIADWSGTEAAHDFATLMRRAPDEGARAADYVIAELRFDAWPPLCSSDPSLGRVLTRDRVQRLLCIDDSARQILRAAPGTAGAQTPELFPRPELWREWSRRVAAAASDRRAHHLLQRLGLPRMDTQAQADFAGALRETRRALTGAGSYEKSKGTCAHGWITALAMAKQVLGTKANGAMRDEIQKLRSDYAVTAPFFTGISAGVAAQVLTDQQYASASEKIIVAAACAHYAYAMQRAEYRSFAYPAFLADIEWLRKTRTDCAALLADQTARNMTDELLWHLLVEHPDEPRLPHAAAAPMAATRREHAPSEPSPTPDVGWGAGTAECAGDDGNAPVSAAAVVQEVSDATAPVASSMQDLAVNHVDAPVTATADGIAAAPAQVASSATTPTAGTSHAKAGAAEPTIDPPERRPQPLEPTAGAPRDDDVNASVGASHAEPDTAKPATEHPEQLPQRLEPAPEVPCNHNVDACRDGVADHTEPSADSGFTLDPKPATSQRRGSGSRNKTRRSPATRRSKDTKKK